MSDESGKISFNPEDWELECTDPETGCQLYLSKVQKGRFMMKAPDDMPPGEVNIIFKKKFKDYIAEVVCKRKD